MLLSILIRNYNEAPDLEKTLLLLQKQKISVPYEIVIADNESTDNSTAIAKSFGCRVVTNKRNGLSYGQLLNFGISHCLGEYVFLLSPHVAIIGEHSLANGLAPLIADAQLAYVCGVQASQVKMLIAGMKPKIFSIHDFPTEKHWQQSQYFLLGAPCGIIRKQVWQKIKFDESLEFSEDRYWSRCVIEEGYKGMFGADLFFFYFKQKQNKENLRRLYAESLANNRIVGKPETGTHFYYRAIKTGLANVYFAFVQFLRLIFTLVKIRLIKKQPRQYPTVGRLSEQKKQA